MIRGTLELVWQSFFKIFQLLKFKLPQGAGFYINATAEKWKNNYNMFRYVTEELPSVIKQNFPLINTDIAGISGHSMGGHGALVCALKRPDLYKVLISSIPLMKFHPSP